MCFAKNISVVEAVERQGAWSRGRAHGVEAGRME